MCFSLVSYRLHVNTRYKWCHVHIQIFYVIYIFSWCLTILMSNILCQYFIYCILNILLLGILLQSTLQVQISLSLSQLIHDIPNPEICILSPIFLCFVISDCSSRLTEHIYYEICQGSDTVAFFRIFRLSWQIGCWQDLWRKSRKWIVVCSLQWWNGTQMGGCDRIDKVFDNGQTIRKMWRSVSVE